MSRKRKPQGGFDIKEHVRPGLSENEILEIKEAFDYFDTDGGGEVSVREFMDSLRKYGFDSQNPEIYDIISDMDEDGNPAAN